MAGENSLTREQREGLADVLGEYPVVAAYLFGARAYGTARPYTHYPLAVLFDEETAIDLRSTQLLAGEIQDRVSPFFGTKTVYVLSLRDLEVGFQYRVIQPDVVLYCADKEKRLRFEKTVQETYDPQKHDTDRNPVGEDEFQYVKNEILRATNPEQIYLYGPCARGDQTPYTAIDLLVVADLESDWLTTVVEADLQMLFYDDDFRIDITVITPEMFHEENHNVDSAVHWAVRWEGRFLYSTEFGSNGNS